MFLFLCYFLLCTRLVSFCLLFRFPPRIFPLHSFCSNILFLLCFVLFFRLFTYHLSLTSSCISFSCSLRPLPLFYRRIFLHHLHLFISAFLRLCLLFAFVFSFCLSRLFFFSLFLSLLCFLIIVFVVVVIIVFFYFMFIVLVVLLSSWCCYFLLRSFSL